MTDHIPRFRGAPPRLMLCIAAAILLVQAESLSADGPAEKLPDSTTVETPLVPPRTLGVRDPALPMSCPSREFSSPGITANESADVRRLPPPSPMAANPGTAAGAAGDDPFHIVPFGAPFGAARASATQFTPPNVEVSAGNGDPTVRLADQVGSGAAIETSRISPVRQPDLRPREIGLAPATEPPRPRIALMDRQREAVSAQADAHVRRGFEMAGRGALATGRSEFIQALRLIAQNADAAEEDHVHSDSLAAGLQALDEAESFVPRGSSLEADLNMDVLIASHRTPVLHYLLDDPDHAHRPTPLEALGRYLTFAQQQLATAADGLPAGAMALYGLGKIHTAMIVVDADSRGLEEPRAIALHQAALEADPRCALAANELGVLLAHYHRYEEARAMLQHSALLASWPETWHNLAVVHAHLGEYDLARRAEQQAALARAQSPAGGPAASNPALARGSVRWLSPVQFAQMRPADTTLQPTTADKPAPAAPPLPPPPATGGGLASWLPWTTKR